MALRIDKAVGRSGITATYWRQVAGGWSFAMPAADPSSESPTPEGVMWLSFVGYRDAAARSDGMEPVPGASHRCSIPYAEMPADILATDGDLRAAAYHLAKRDPFFADAADC